MITNEHAIDGLAAEIAPLPFDLMPPDRQEAYRDKARRVMQRLGLVVVAPDLIREVRWSEQHEPHDQQAAIARAKVRLAEAVLAQFPDEPVPYEGEAP